MDRKYHQCAKEKEFKKSITRIGFIVWMVLMVVGFAAAAAADNSVDSETFGCIVLWPNNCVFNRSHFSFINFRIFCNMNSGILKPSNSIGFGKSWFFKISLWAIRLTSSMVSNRICEFRWIGDRIRCWMNQSVSYYVYVSQIKTWNIFSKEKKCSQKFVIMMLWWIIMPKIHIYHLIYHIVYQIWIFID